MTRINHPPQDIPDGIGDDELLELFEKSSFYRVTADPRSLARAWDHIYFQAKAAILTRMSL